MKTIADGCKGEKEIITSYNIRELQAGNEITRQLYVTHIGYYPLFFSMGHPKNKKNFLVTN